jgi:hypothetical protein
MLVLSNAELFQVSGAGPIPVSDLLPLVPLGASIGAAAASSAAIEAAGGLGAFGSLGAALGGIAGSGVASSFIAGMGIGYCIGSNDFIRDRLSDVFLEAFGSD